MNLSIAEANTHPQGSAARAAGYAAAKDILEQYLTLVPTLSEPHYVLADILLASGDTAGAQAEAAKGKEYYTSNASTAKRAAQFYEKMQDLPDAAFFLNEVYRLDPTDYAFAYDLAKVEYLLGDKEKALGIFNELQHTDPAIVNTDPNFVQAITTYERTR